MTEKQALSNWFQLNNFLRGCTEKQAEKLLAQEKAGANRKVQLLRIHSTYNKLRGRREREELERTGLMSR